MEKKRGEKETKQATLLNKKPNIEEKRTLLHLGTIYFFFGFTYEMFSAYYAVLQEEYEKKN